MTDSQNTRTAPFSRRAVVAGLAAAPVAGLPAIAGAAVYSAPLSKELAAALERHKPAYAPVEAHCGTNEDIPDDVSDSEIDALWELAIAPCTSDAELITSFAICSNMNVAVPWAGHSTRG